MQIEKTIHVPVNEFSDWFYSAKPGDALVYAESAQLGKDARFASYSAKPGDALVYAESAQLGKDARFASELGLLFNMVQDFAMGGMIDLTQRVDEKPLPAPHCRTFDYIATKRHEIDKRPCWTYGKGFTQDILPSPHQHRARVRKARPAIGVHINPAE